jgi:hypothetical protein
MKHGIANNGAVQIASISDNEVEDGSLRCQPGQATGGSDSSNIAAVPAKRSRAIRIAVRGKFTGPDKLGYPFLAFPCV